MHALGILCLCVLTAWIYGCIICDDAKSNPPALAINAEARRPRIEMYEIRLNPSSNEDREEPSLKRISEVPKSNSGAAQIARNLVEQIDLLLAGPVDKEQDDEQSASSSSREPFVDNTRSSIVLVPADGDSVYHIVRELKQKPAETKAMPVLPWVISQQKGDYEKRLGNKRQKRGARSPQWDVIVGNPKKHGFEQQVDY